MSVEEYFPSLQYCTKARPQNFGYTQCAKKACLYHKNVICAVKKKRPYTNSQNRHLDKFWLKTA